MLLGQGVLVQVLLGCMTLTGSPKPGSIAKEND